MQDPKSVFFSLLTETFDKLKKQLSAKKFKEERELCAAAQELAKSDSSLDANKYYPTLKRALDTKATKILETALYYIQKLISHGFLNGNSEDKCEYSTPPAYNSKRQRRLIDGIVESICYCVHERDDNVQLQVIKTLLTTVTSFNCEVHDRILLEAFRACYHIHITSKNVVNQATAKATLTQMLHFVLQRMESTAVDHSGEPVSSVLIKLTRGLVDDVELFESRKQVNEYAPLRAVPYALSPDDLYYRTVVATAVLNEEGVAEGKFGWCVECRTPAAFYCKESRDPVCSEKCRRGHLQSLLQADRALGKSGETEYFYDAALIFRSICKLSLKELSSSVSTFTFKSKILSLELILAAMDNPGPAFSSRTQFTNIIKNNLCESLLKNSLSSERTIFTLSLSIFVALVTNFKDSLRHEIGVFLHEIFIKILESEHSNLHQKLLVVEVFFRITQNPRTTLELFLNYDCNVDESDLFARMIDILRRIAVGKSKFEDTQEHALRVTAIETLANIMITQAN